MAFERHKGKCIIHFLTICTLITTIESVVSGCKEGFFGYNCLYRNEFKYKNYNVSELADDRYDTCVNEATNLTITFRVTRVLFVRLIVKDNTQYKNVEFTFQTNDTCKTCDGSFLLTDSNIVEYHCSCLVTSDGLTISNIGRKPICHIEVTEGRNIVPLGTIEAPPSMPQYDDYTFKGMTDDITEYKYQSCYLSWLKNDWNNVTTTFNKPLFVNVIELYDYKYRYDSFDLCHITLLDINDKVIWTFQMTGAQEVRRLINHKPDVAVHMIQLARIQILFICEMRFFGDCPEGEYGTACTENCNQGCSGGCDITGRCKFGCLPGFYQVDCSKECSKNCGQDGSCDINGICNFGCLQGYSGERCTEMRSDFRTVLDIYEPSYKSGVCKQGLIENKETYSIAARVFGKVSLTLRNLLVFEILLKSSLYFKTLCEIPLDLPCGGSQVSRECYCKNSTNEVLEIILNKTAELVESEATVRVSLFVCGSWNYSNNVSLPVIYVSEVVSLYLDYLPLDLNKCRVTLKPEDTLRFCVQNLVSYSMTLAFSYAKTSSSLDCVEHFFEYEPSLKSREFNVSYQENVGCMRSRSFTCQWFYKEEKRSTFNDRNNNIKIVSSTWTLLLMTNIVVFLY